MQHECKQLTEITRKVTINIAKRALMCVNKVVYKVYRIMLLLTTTTLSHAITCTTNARLVIYMQYIK